MVIKSVLENDLSELNNIIQEQIAFKNKIKQKKEEENGIYEENV